MSCFPLFPPTQPPFPPSSHLSTFIIHFTPLHYASFQALSLLMPSFLPVLSSFPPPPSFSASNLLFSLPDHFPLTIYPLSLCVPPFLSPLHFPDNTYFVFPTSSVLGPAPFGFLLSFFGLSQTLPCLISFPSSLSCFISDWRYLAPSPVFQTLSQLCNTFPLPACPFLFFFPHKGVPVFHTFIQLLFITCLPCSFVLFIIFPILTSYVIPSATASFPTLVLS